MYFDGYFPSGLYNGDLKCILTCDRQPWGPSEVLKTHGPPAPLILGGVLWDRVILL